LLNEEFKKWKLEAGETEPLHLRKQSTGTTHKRLAEMIAESWRQSVATIRDSQGTVLHK